MVSNLNQSIRFYFYIKILIDERNSFIFKESRHILTLPAFLRNFKGTIFIYFIHINLFIHVLPLCMHYLRSNHFVILIWLWCSIRIVHKSSMSRTLFWWNCDTIQGYSTFQNCSTIFTTTIIYVLTKTITNKPVLIKSKFEAN